MKIFGYTIEKAEVPQTVKSFVAPTDDGGVETIRAGGYYGTYLDIDGIANNEIELIRKYREIAGQADIDTAIDDIVNEAISHDVTGRTVDIVLDKLLENIAQIKPNINEWKIKCDHYRNEYPIINDDYKDDKYVNSYSFVNKLTQLLSDDEIIVTDMGTGLLSGHQASDLKENQTMFTSQGLGEMGVGLPYAIGAAFAEPNKQITCLNCDGGIMMNLQELQTIVQHNLPVKIFIFNNDGYLMIKHTQKLFFNGRYNSVDANTGVVLPEFEKIAYGFKIPYVRIDRVEDLDGMNLNYNSPVIIEVFIDPEQNFIPKVKGVILEDESIFAPPLEEMSPLLPFETIQKEKSEKLREKRIEEEQEMRRKKNFEKREKKLAKRNKF